MKVLHLLSNWKWTERSEPAVDLAVAQSKLGAEIRFVCGNDVRGISGRRDVEDIVGAGNGDGGERLVGSPRHQR